MRLTVFLFLAQLTGTFAMTGLIWFVQVVHYPLFALVPNPHHASYAANHQTRTGWIVAPVMLVELVTSGMMLSSKFRLSSISLEEAIIGAFLVGLIWASTALLQIPLHSALITSLDEKTVRRLVATNWLRTVAWTFRCCLILFWLTREIND